MLKNKKSEFMNLIKAISDLDKYRICREDMVILAPKGVLISIIYSEFGEYCLNFVDSTYDKPMKFQGILVVEDECINKVVIKSLISDHKIELDSIKRGEHSNERDK